ncbi:unnamed protein product [Adineta steineri]|uniref:Apple domain-containing protein n=1 Tax=Adineta steineri TaxID=433720 RepID=A0A814ZYL1_9BILA|nr:unnamed protein product [Adineta steineri]CAF3953329.1 unnamed protein product [Adineta steineri]
MIFIAVLIINILSFDLFKCDINWNGNDWAHNCEFKENDLSNARVPADQCGGKCAATPECTHFTWTNYESGTCWMKKGSASKSDAYESYGQQKVCGVVKNEGGGHGINWNGNNWALNCGFKGNDLSNVQVPADQCGGKCAVTAGCTHFTWTNYQGGTCWMKQGWVSKTDAFSTGDQTVVCGIQPNSVEPTAPPSSSTRKRGIAWPMENKQDSPNVFSGGKIAWIYNWSPYKTDVAGMEFVPMLWSTNRGHDGNTFLSQAKGARVVLGFNEPERGEQASLDPAVAARAWKQYIEPLSADGTRLGSPAIASTNEGLNWMQQFLSELDRLGGRIDFLTLHWYGRGSDNFINWITAARQRFGNKYPVWVTEFACTSWNPSQPVSQQEVNDFMTQSIAKLDSLNWVERYAWFGAQRHLDAALGSTNCLIGSDGQLSELGRKYVHEL